MDAVHAPSATHACTQLAPTSVDHSHASPRLAFLAIHESAASRKGRACQNMDSKSAAAKHARHGPAASTAKDCRTLVQVKGRGPAKDARVPVGHTSRATRAAASDNYARTRPCFWPCAFLAPEYRTLQVLLRQLPMAVCPRGHGKVWCVVRLFTCGTGIVRCQRGRPPHNKSMW